MLMLDISLVTLLQKKSYRNYISKWKSLKELGNKFVMKKLVVFNLRYFY
jgi:hypothetical protein